MGVYELEMEHTQKKKGFFSRIFSKTTYAELVEKMETYVEDTNSDLSFILAPTYLM